jgi:lactobin A/cerein 7B family class IIb bacteriocin
MTTTSEAAIRELNASDLDAVSGGFIEWIIIGGIAVAVFVAVAVATSGNHGHGTSLHSTGH